MKLIDSGKPHDDALLENSDGTHQMGLGSWRPKWLQKFNSIKWFMFLLAIFSLVQGIVVSGLVNISIQSIEKEFGLSSKITGVILAGNDAGAVIVVTFVSFFGSRNKPKWMAIGAIVSGFGGFVFVLPKLLAGQYQQRSITQPGLDICLTNETVSTDSTLNYNGDISDKRTLHAVIFIVGQLIMGVGTTPIRTLGPAYLDENVSPRASPIYLGIWFTFMMMGPGFGFAVGSLFLKIYTDFEVPEGFSIDIKDPRWVGAWWLGFVMLSGVFVLIGLMFALFPKEMEGNKTKRDQSIELGELPSAGPKLTFTVKGYFKECFKLIFNKVFMLASFALAIKTIYAVGLGGFIIKIIVIKFGSTESKASILCGGTMLIAMTLGVMGGSVGMRKLKVRIAAKTGAKICAIVSFITLANAVIFLVPGCNNTNIAGVVVPYNDSSIRNSMAGLVSSCNAKCHCSRYTYLPVCGSDGITYHSPCYAGCQAVIRKNNTVYFGNCTCIPTLSQGNNSQFALGRDSQQNGKPQNIYNQAISGTCDRACKNLYLFFGLLVIGIVISFAAGTPHKIMVLRCVPDNKRAFALGMQYLIMKCFSFMPGPVIMGAIVDSYCITWKYDSHGTKKNCLDYDLVELSSRFVLYGICTSVGSAILYALCWWFYPESDNVEVHIKVLDEDI